MTTEDGDVVAKLAAAEIMTESVEARNSELKTSLTDVREALNTDPEPSSDVGEASRLMNEIVDDISNDFRCVKEAKRPLRLANNSCFSNAPVISSCRQANRPSQSILFSLRCSGAQNSSDAPGDETRDPAGPTSSSGKSAGGRETPGVAGEPSLDMRTSGENAGLNSARPSTGATRGANIVTENLLNEVSAVSAIPAARDGALARASTLRCTQSSG